MWLVHLFLFLVILFGASVEPKKITKPVVVQWEPCTSEDGSKISPQVGTIKQIRVYANCTQRCQLQINSSVEIEVDFEPGEETKSLAPEMSGLLGPIEVPFPQVRTDVCDSIVNAKGESCPLKKGVFYTYRREIPIKDEYPPIVVDIKWKFINEKKNIAVCFVIKSELVL